VTHDSDRIRNVVKIQQKNFVFVF